MPIHRSSISGGSGVKVWPRGPLGGVPARAVPRRVAASDDATPLVLSVSDRYALLFFFSTTPPDLTCFCGTGVDRLVKVLIVSSIASWLQRQPVIRPSAKDWRWTGATPGDRSFTSVGADTPDIHVTWRPHQKVREAARRYVNQPSPYYDLGFT